MSTWRCSGRRKTQCVSVRRQPGARQRGEESREGDRYVPTRHESRPCSTLQVCFVFGKKNSTTLQFPRPSQIWGLPTRRGHGYGPSLEGLRKTWALLAAIGRIVIRHEQVAQFLQAREVTRLSLWHTEPVGYYEMAPGTVFKCTVGIRALRCTGLSLELDAPGKTYWQANTYNGKMWQNRLCIGQKRFFPKKLSTDCCQPSEQLAKAVSSKQVTQPLEDTLREQ